VSTEDLSAKIAVPRDHQIALEFGGLRLEIYYTPNFGDSTRVFSSAYPGRELLRFDDFVDAPHYHAPADDPEQIDLDVEAIGEPRQFFLDFLVRRLPEILPTIGFGHVLETLDLTEVQRHLGVVQAAMDSVLVEGFYRVDARGLQDSDRDRPQLRDEANARFALRLQALREARSAPTA
jgi:hypothetical protein